MDAADCILNSAPDVANFLTNFRWRSQKFLRLSLTASVLGLGFSLLMPMQPVRAAGLGGAWSTWLASGTTSQAACLAKARQTLIRQRFIRVASEGAVAYGDSNSNAALSVFITCSALGDQAIVFVTSNDFSEYELQRIRNTIANEFLAETNF